MMFGVLRNSRWNPPALVYLFLTPHGLYRSVFLTVSCLDFSLTDQTAQMAGRTGIPGSARLSGSTNWVHPK